VIFFDDMICLQEFAELPFHRDDPWFTREPEEFDLLVSFKWLLWVWSYELGFEIYGDECMALQAGLWTEHSGFVGGLCCAVLWITTGWVDRFHLLLVDFQSWRGLMLRTMAWRVLYPSQQTIPRDWVLTPCQTFSTCKSPPPGHLLPCKTAFLGSVFTLIFGEESQVDQFFVLTGSGGRLLFLQPYEWQCILRLPSTWNGVKCHQLCARVSSLHRVAKFVCTWSTCLTFITSADAWSCFFL
jgi:hypothetical protein